MSLKGIEYSPEFVKSPPEKCSDITPFELNLIYAFTTKKQSANNWVEFQAKCQNLLFPDIVLIKENESRTQRPLLEMEKALKMKFDSKNKDHQSFLKKLERKNFHQMLLEIIISASLNKNEWMTSAIIDVLGRDIEYYSVWINQNIPTASRQKYAAFINQVFDIVNESNIDELYKLMFFKKFTHISSGDSRLKLTQLLNQTFGSTLEFDISSYKYGIKMAPYWIQELDNFNLKKHLVEKYFTTPAMHNFDEFKNILFEYNIPNVGKLREQLLDKIAKDYKDYSFEMMMGLIVGLRNPVFKKEMVKRDKFFARPVFSIERTYLNEKINDRKSSWIAFNLLYLGQRDENIIKNIMVDL